MKAVAQRPPPRLLLVGAGHAHLEVLRRLAAEEHPPGRIVLISEEPRQLYSGMVPGYLAGTYGEDEVAVPLAPLAERAGAELVVARATAIDPAERRVTLADGTWLPYDLLSLDVGSRAAGRDLPGASDHAVPVKPIGRAVRLRERLEGLAGGERGRPRRVAVVGAGAAGIEVALAAAAVLDGAGDAREIRLLEAGDQILAGYSGSVRRRAVEVLARRGIETRIGAAVAAVGPDAVTLESGEILGADLTIWLAGAAAPALFAGLALPLDDAGFLLVDRHLRSPADPRIFAAGDCATPIHHPHTPKAGVYAVRQAPILWRNLRAALAGGEPRATFEPQSGFLSLLATADGRAILSWKGLAAHGRWAWWLKDWIDRRFVARYRV